MLVTGMTGAGRGSAAKVLEKLGYYVIDNLPPGLLSQAVATVQESKDIDRLAVVVDARSRQFFGGLVEALEELRDDGVHAKILYLEASDEVLVRRQEAARRPHPLSLEGRLMDGLDRERELLNRIRGRADIVVDTSNLNVHQLGQRVRAAFEDPDSGGLRASVMSFGFKYGLPIDADMVADLRFLPNPFWVDELRPMSGLDEPVRDYVLRQPRSSEFLEQYEGPRRAPDRRLPARGQALPDHRDRLHRRAPPQRRDVRGVRRAAARPRRTHAGRPPRPGARMSATRPAHVAGRAEGDLKVVSLGGGHGLAASLSALRRLTTDLTGVVTVADNGGSSGRIRAELGGLPPGDLRMALAALCGDDDWGRTWAAVLQHRFSGNGPLKDHAVGNLLIAAIWDQVGDHVAGLDLVGELLGAQGRVLPMAAVPLDIEADVHLRSAPDRLTLVRGQVEVSSTDGQVVSVRLDPHDPPACPEAVAAVEAADWVVVGPGSWFTSVMPTLLVPGLRDALTKTKGKRILVLNLLEQEGETEGLTPTDHLEVLAAHAPELGLDAVIADTSLVDTRGTLESTARSLGARLYVADVAASPGSDQHDPGRLAAAFARVMRTA